MADREQMNEIIAKGREDGAKLFRVATAIYQGLIAINWLVGGMGALATLFFFIQAMGSRYASGTYTMMGLSTLVGTAFVCLMNYAFAVLATHGAKVLVHILFANLALLPTGDERGMK